MPAPQIKFAAASGAAMRILLLDWQRLGRARNAVSPDEVLVVALEITHPKLEAPVRVVNDAQAHEIEGHEYLALAFGARLADDVEGQSPRAQLTVDNVGRELTRWFEEADGGFGARVRMLQVLSPQVAGQRSEIDYELIMDVSGVSIDQQQVTVSLGFDPLLSQPAVRIRHDPSVSPGLF